MRLAVYSILLFIALAPVSTKADRLRLAVASNFKPAMNVLIPEFEVRAGHELSVSYSSTGKHFAQIVNGAPFDLFLAADAERPAHLEAKGLAVAGSRATYAVGRIVLWSPARGLFEDGRSALNRADFRFLAIANPRIAPYGRAAEQVLERIGVWQALQPRIVRGESIGQAFAHVRSGNAELGFIAGSQLAGVPEAERGSVWDVPADLYDPIEQQVVLLKESQAGREFIDFLMSERAAEVLSEHEYGRP